MRLIDLIKRYKNSYKNYPSVMFKLAIGKKEISVKLRNGILKNWVSECVTSYTRLNHPIEETPLNILDNYSNAKLRMCPLELIYNNRAIKFFPNSSGGNFGAFLEIFVENTYKQLLPCEGETVIDVGANIGDSSIYFALNDAKRVIALEPYPLTFNLAVQNIKVNNLNNKITILNSGYGKASETVKVEEKNWDTGMLVSSSGGKEIKLYSLKSLLNEFNIKEALLKMDCEGCEYNILNEDDDTLRRFKKIVLEFHYGYKNIENKLKNVGFSTKAIVIQKSSGDDQSLKSMALKNKDYTLGLLYAELI